MKTHPLNDRLVVQMLENEDKSTREQSSLTEQKRNQHREK